MAELTIEQRAKRRATRHNNKAKHDLPLFVGTAAIEPFLTDAETQRAVVEHHMEAGRQYLERLHALDAEFERRVEEFKRVLKDLIGWEYVAEWEKEEHELIARWPALNAAAYRADHWRIKLRYVQDALAKERESL